MSCRWSEPTRWLAATLLGLATMAAQAGEDPRLNLGRQLFSAQAQPSCGLCHSLRDAGTSGTIGPDLDQLKPDARRVAAALRGGVGVMPSFADSLSDEQIEALAHYIAQVAGR